MTLEPESVLKVETCALLEAVRVAENKTPSTSACAMVPGGLPCSNQGQHLIFSLLSSRRHRLLVRMHDKRTDKGVNGQGIKFFYWHITFAARSTSCSIGELATFDIQRLACIPPTL